MANLDVTAANLQPSLPGVTNAQAQPDRERMRTGGIVRVIGRLLILILPVGFSLLFLYPFFWLLAASLKPKADVFDNSLIPKDVSSEQLFQRLE